mmetsp:Transcript_2616/g.6306  ORF Transcript_2616/g.6306 Transcript_2616/m.6306 type:complete len:375 (+) Transcript_2616:1154-2278(+)
MFVADFSAHAIRQVDPNTGLVTTFAGVCGTSGYKDGSPLAAMFNMPSALHLSTDKDMILVGEYLGHRVRAITTCDNDVCAFGQWRGPCNAKNRGACLDCSKGTNSVFTAAATPFNQDACAWECSVGFYLTAPLVCTACSNPKPSNSAYSSNGGSANSCPWRCIGGYEQKSDAEQGEYCSLIPASQCVVGKYDSQAGSCAGGHFFAQSCSRNEETWQEELNTKHGPEIDALITDATCKAWVDSLCAVFGGNVTDPLSEKICPDAMCEIRRWMLERRIGTCATISDCPQTVNNTHLICCNELQNLITTGCVNYDFDQVSGLVGGRIANPQTGADICQYDPKFCVHISAAVPRHRAFSGLVWVLWAAAGVVAHRLLW